MESCNDNYCVYVHTNKINGKKYIGQTRQKPTKRWGKDGTGYKPKKDNTCKFWNAIQKYGWDNFEHEVLFENLSLEMANLLEEELIKKYNTTDDDFGYNMRFGGDNRRLSEEIREKISTARKGHNYGMIGENAPMYGKHHSEEARKKISKAIRGDNNPFYGKHHSEELKRQMCELRGKKVICIETGVIYNSIREAVRDTGIRRCCIIAVLHNRQKTAGGFHWACYIEETGVEEIVA